MVNDLRPRHPSYLTFPIDSAVMVSHYLILVSSYTLMVIVHIDRSAVNENYAMQVVLNLDWIGGKPRLMYLASS